MKKEKRHVFLELMQQIKTHKSTFVVYVVLRALVIAALVMAAVRGNYQHVWYCTLSLILFMAPAFIQKNFGITLPSTLEIIILLFIFASEILGEIHNYYTRFEHWDTTLHTLNGFLCAAVGFALVDILNQNSKVKFKLSPVFLAVVAFCFSMTIGVLWEFLEFSCDYFFHTDMQKDYIVHTLSSFTLDPAGQTLRTITDITEVTVNGQPLGVGGYIDIGLIDTMKDMMVNFVGAVVFSIIGYFYVKNRGKGKFARRFIPEIRADYDLALKDEQAVES